MNIVRFVTTKTNMFHSGMGQATRATCHLPVRYWVKLLQILEDKTAFVYYLPWIIKELKTAYNKGLPL